MIYVHEISGNICYLNDKTYVRDIWIYIRYLIKNIRYLRRNILNLKDNIVPSTIVYLPTLGEIFVTFQVRLVSSGGMIRYLKVNIH